MTAAQISTKTGVGPITVMKIKKEITGVSGAETPEGDATAEPKRPVNLREQVETLSTEVETLATELKLEKLKNKHLRAYANVNDDSEKKGVEINYLMARAEIFGDVTIRRLADEQDDEDEVKTDSETE